MINNKMKSLMYKIFGDKRAEEIESQMEDTPEELKFINKRNALQDAYSNPCYWCHLPGIRGREVCDSCDRKRICRNCKFWCKYYIDKTTISDKPICSVKLSEHYEKETDEEFTCKLWTYTK